MDPAGVLPYTLLEKIKYEVTRNGVYMVPTANHVGYPGCNGFHGTGPVSPCALARWAWVGLQTSATAAQAVGDAGEAPTALC
jgi:hypothetical protein